VDDLADAQEELLKGSVVVVQVHQTDAKKISSRQARL
jgi:hypothetical protein